MRSIIARILVILLLVGVVPSLGVSQEVYAQEMLRIGWMWQSLRLISSLCMEM